METFSPAAAGAVPSILLETGVRLAILAEKGMSMESFFATTARGLEEILAEELRVLGMRDIRTGTAGAGFDGDMADCMRANLHLRTANRVVLSLAEFECGGPEDLYEGVRGIDWQRFFKGDETLAVSGTVRNSPITHSLYAALTVKDAVCDSLREQTGSRPNVDRRDPDIRVTAGVIGYRAFIGIDTSGESLHLRGYRASSVEAPLRETLAAGLVLFTGWTGDCPLYDPMCGSGTIAVEAALIARRIPPNLNRERFGFMRLPGFDRAEWERMRDEARAAIVPGDCTIDASDADESAVEIARRNARTAGVDSLVRFTRRGLADFPRVAPPAVVVVNPPYGARLGRVKELRSLYRSLGEVFRKRLHGSTAWVFTGNAGLAKYIPLKPSEKHTLYNGAIRCKHLRFDIR